MKSKKYAGVSALVFVLLTAFDQWTKQLAVTHLMGKAPKVLISGVLELQYLENRGAAFGILQNHRFLLVVPALIFLAAALFFCIRLPKTRRMLPLHSTLLVLAAGALGNVIDRIRLKYVVDFISFVLIDFPIFNVADIYVVVSVAVLFLLILFYYKDEEFAGMLPGKKKEN